MMSLACGSSDQATTKGECPVDPLNIVVTVDQWGQLTEQLTGDCAEVTTIIAGTSADPHEFEPTPADLVAFDNADLVVMNGVGYDAWATKALDQLGGDLPVISAGDVAGRNPGDNPHVWFSPDAVRQMSAAVTDEVAILLPEAVEYLDTQSASWATKVEPYDSALRSLVAAVDSLDEDTGDGDVEPTFASTEPVADDLAESVGLRNVTPSGYRSAALNETDPSPSDLAEFTQTVADGDATVLIVNAQSRSAFADELIDQAVEAEVAVVEVTETIPPGSGDFVNWQVNQIEALRHAIAPWTTAPHE